MQSQHQPHWSRAKTIMPISTPWLASLMWPSVIQWPTAAQVASPSLMPRPDLRGTRENSFADSEKMVLQSRETNYDRW